MNCKRRFATATCQIEENGIVSSMQDVAREIDVTADVCPMTFVRTRLALDKLAPGDILLVKLKGQEPLHNVPRTAKEQGHEVLSLDTDAAGISTGTNPQRQIISHPRQA